MGTYEEYTEKNSSEKIALVLLDASKRLVGWELHSGSVYKITFNEEVINKIEDSGTGYTSVSELSSVVASTYFFDRNSKLLYLESSDSSDPNSRFIAVEFRLYFSNVPTTIPNDLSSGYDVYTNPLVKTVSNFTMELDNQNQIGNAIEGSGSVNFQNDRSFWDSTFDKIFFENKLCQIYSWNRGVPITDARLLFRGRVTQKTYAENGIRFTLKDLLYELRNPFNIPNLSAISGALIPEGLNNKKNRRLYGYTFGVLPVNVDQVLDGYLLTGTVAITVNTTTVTGTGTQFLTDFSPDDEIVIGDNEKIAIESIASDTSLTLTDSFAGATETAAAIKIVPSKAKRYINRKHVFAHHALKEPATTIAKVNSPIQFELTDATNFLDGEEILINSQRTTIKFISGNIIKTTTTLAIPPAPGQSVIRPSISNVKLGDEDLILTRDYTVDPVTASITLDDLAEFNISPTKPVIGTVTFNATTSVTGSGTIFTKQFESDDFIRASGETDFFEILSVDSDTSITLKSAASYSAVGAAQRKNPANFEEGTTKITADCLGITKDDTKTGIFPVTASAIVRDILERGNLSPSLETTSFDTSAELAPQRLGIKIPEEKESESVPILREVISKKINPTVFGSLIQNNDFKLEYNVLRPNRTVSAKRFDRSDAIKFSITTDSQKIIKTVNVKYQAREFDPQTEDKSFQVESTTSNIGSFLAETSKELTIESSLADQEDAITLSQRYAFLLELASNKLKIGTKLRGVLVDVNDVIDFSHPYMFERLGSTQRRKLAAVQKITKNHETTEIELEDLANAFTRCGVIAVDTTNDFDTSTDDEKSTSGYITDDFGMQGNLASTFGINLIW